MDRQVIIHQHILQTHLPDACKLLMGKITEFVDCNIVNINKKEITDFFNWNIHKVNKCLQKLEKENIIEIIDNKTIKLFYYHRYLPEFQFLHLDDVSVLRKIYNDLEDDDNIYTNLYCGNVITKSLLALNLNDACTLLMSELLLNEWVRDKKKKTIKISKISIKKTLYWSIKKIDRILTRLRKEKILKYKKGAHILLF